jgi:hypothetical protein
LSFYISYALKFPCLNVFDTGTAFALPVNVSAFFSHAAENKKEVCQMHTESKTPSRAEKIYPDEKDMFNVFRNIIGKWVDSQVKHIGSPVLGPSVMSLERSVYFSAHVKGMLNVRSHQKFGQALADSIMSKDPGHQSVSKEDAFQLAVDHYCAVLISGRNAQAYQAHSSSPSGPYSWPKQKPHAACALLAGRFPVEIRFWIEEGGDIREVVESKRREKT